MSEKVDLLSEECTREVLSQGSYGNQVQLDQQGATSRTCSSSSLILHSVCVSILLKIAVKKPHFDCNMLFSIKTVHSG